MDAKEKAPEIIKRLRKEYPELKTALQFGNPFELLVATILSAQTTDVLVNKITENLFKKYRAIKDYADAPPGTFQKDISSVNFYKTKAKNIQNTAKMLLEQFHATVPKTMEELIRLPGVARKTANIILFNAYGINEGIAVDTHVKRLANRLGLTRNENPVKIEQDLMKIIPRDQWGNITHLLIFHGRKICPARKPNHRECILYDICPSRNI
ncbi:MAG: endonuclease III [Thermodesulfovibrionales bacterium]|jgi:endonuclease-3|nr:endonuclease III [Thermodesulfovibrionales bacterium]